MNDVSSQNGGVGIRSVHDGPKKWQFRINSGSFTFIGWSHKYYPTCGLLGEVGQRGVARVRLDTSSNVDNDPVKKCLIDPWL